MPITIEEFIFFAGASRKNRNKDYKTQDMFQCASQLWDVFVFIYNLKYSINCIQSL